MPNEEDLNVCPVTQAGSHLSLGGQLLLQLSVFVVPYQIVDRVATLLWGFLRRYHPFRSKNSQFLSLSSRNGNDPAHHPSWCAKVSGDHRGPFWLRKELPNAPLIVSMDWATPLFLTHPLLRLLLPFTFPLMSTPSSCFTPPSLR